jgi:putative spermidine/putrescine transport system permease protein
LDFIGKDTLQAVLLSPLFVPHFTIGLGLLILAAQSRMERGYAIVVFCHVMLVLPFVLRSVYVSMENLDERLEQAAASLGASPVKVLFSVVIPLLAPGLFGGWLFAAIMSFNEFTASLFVTTQATQTLPVSMYNYVRQFADPTLAALSVVYIAVTAGLLVIANYFLGLGKVLNIEESR